MFLVEIYHEDYYLEIVVGKMKKIFAFGCRKWCTVNIWRVKPTKAVIHDTLKNSDLKTFMKF